MTKNEPKRPGRARCLNAQMSIPGTGRDESPSGQKTFKNAFAPQMEDGKLGVITGPRSTVLIFDGPLGRCAMQLGWSLKGLQRSCCPQEGPASHSDFPV